nr:importin subunit beta-3-like isoform X1 [Tanacetum cinerariifolium]
MWEAIKRLQQDDTEIDHTNKKKELKKKQQKAAGTKVNKKLLKLKNREVFNAVGDTKSEYINKTKDIEEKDTKKAQIKRGKHFAVESDIEYLVRIVALGAAVNFVQCLEKSSDRDTFLDLLPLMMMTLTKALNSGEESIAQDALDLLIELVGTKPRILRKSIMEVMTKNLEHVVSMILNSLQDPHPRDRWAAINAVGQLSTDLGSYLQTLYHHLVLPALASAMDGYQNLRLRSTGQVDSALLKVCEEGFQYVIPMRDGKAPAHFGFKWFVGSDVECVKVVKIVAKSYQDCDSSIGLRFCGKKGDFEQGLKICSLLHFAACSSLRFAIYSSLCFALFVLRCVLFRGQEVEARLVEFKEHEVKFCKKIRGLERDLEIIDNKIEYLKNDLEQVKKEKESLDNKLTGFENASKDLYNLLGSQRSNKNKEGLGYNDVPPPAQIYSPPKKDLSWIGLPEFVDDTVTDYSRLTPSIDASKCNKIELQSSKFSVSKHGESSGSIMSKPMIKFVKEADCPRVIKINNTENARKSTVKYAEMYMNISKVNIARPKAVINAVKTNWVNDVKASACWVWKPIKPNSASITLKRYDYVDVRARSSQMHNNIMAVGSRDRPSMLATGRYPQWRSRFLRYSDTRPNGEALKKCILSGPYKPTTVLVQVVDATNDSSAIPKHTTVETPMNMSPENKAHFESEKETIRLILTGIGDEIYSTVDACQTAQEMWEAIERLQQGESLNIQDVKINLFWKFGKFTSHDEETMESYYTRFYKPEWSRNQRTVNVVGAREKVGSPVVQQSGIQCFNCKEFRHFAKECRKLKRVKDSAYHKEKMLLCKQAEQGVPLQAEQYDWLADTDEEIDEQELNAHYSYMAKIQEVPTTDSGTDSEPVEQVQNEAGYNVFANDLQRSKQSESVSNTCLVETDDSNVIPDSLDMCEDAIQNDQNDVESDDEHIEILIQTCLMPLAIKTQNESFIFVHELKQEMHADLKYVESLEKEINELESDKAEFSNMYDMKLQECVSKDVMCSYLLSLSDLDALDELQCLYLHKVKECDSLAQKLSNQTESVSKEVHSELLKRFAKVENHSISLEITLQKRKEQVKNDTVWNEKASNVFQKEREQYIEIQDLKAQLQDKNIAISELKKLIEKGKGKSVDTKFDKPFVIRQPNAQRIPKPSVLGVNHKTNVSRPQHRSNQLKDKVVPNNSQVKLKKTQVEVHPRIPSVSNKMTSVTATKKPNVVPISTRKPKGHANKSVATSHKKKVASEPTNQKP